MKLLTSYRIFRVTLALVVALWMAGAGCLLGCEKSMGSAATEVDTQSEAPVLAATDQVCASHGAKAKRSDTSQHHVKPAPVRSTARSNNSKPSFGNTRTLAADAGSSSTANCPLAVNAAAALSKSGPDNTVGSVVVTGVQKNLPKNIQQGTAFARPLRQPNRGHTYLQCCAFLI